MTISINVPEEVMDRLRADRGDDLSRRTLEALATEAYREGTLSSAEVGRLLGHESRWETEAFLHDRKAHLLYTEEDLTRDMEMIRDATAR